MKFFILLISGLLFLTYTNAQSKFVNYKSNLFFEKYKDDISKSIKKNNSKYEGSVTVNGSPNLFIENTTEFQIIPLIKISINFDKNRNSCILSYYCEDPKSLILISRHDNYSVYEYSINDSTISLLGQSRSSRYLNIRNSYKSDEISFFYLLEKEKYLGNNALVINKDSTLFVNCNSLKKFGNGVDFLSFSYGSISQFMLLITNDLEDGLISKEAFKNFDVKTEAVNFIKKSWRFHAEFSPKDTSKNIEFILKDINNTIKINQQQLTSIIRGIKQKLSLPEKVYTLEDIRNAGNEPTFMFMKKNIYPTLMLSLSKDQLKEYLFHAKIDDLRFHRVDQYIYYNCVNQSYSSIDDKVEADKKYIISLFDK